MAYDYSSDNKRLELPNPHRVENSFLFACAAITLRMYLPLSLVAGVPMSTCYPIIAWMCWLPLPVTKLTGRALEMGQPEDFSP